MRFLCLPGAYGSIDKFKVQLAPLLKEFESDSKVSFHFIQGPYEVVPPPGYEDFFGGPPYYRFIVPSDTDADTTDVIERIRDFPQLETPELTMRELMTYGVAKTDDSARETLNYLYQLLETEGPFDGIVGYSEGATIAGTLLLHEQMREKEEGRTPMLKCALFFGGWPPMTPTLDGLVLADESDLMIEVPTTHIIGSLDPYLHGNIALYNICDPDTAFIFDHAKGHTLPRDKNMVKELGDIIRRMIDEVDGGTSTP
ncbi:serine hydrolase FSH [Ampelomyces quisqualis]|uniref:Serine hydrolase FSH n=1 Tax=Ampelomyces quisqualis TaxID=50730 RepID=A0A6A5QB30_AMPQU|nr:serine hydrolase FSH [Ampelomyces quisqualis]